MRPYDNYDAERDIDTIENGDCSGHLILTQILKMI